MDNLFLLLLGIIILLASIYDILYTALVSNGAGIGTRWLSRKIWSLLFFLSGKNAKSKLLGHSGMIIIIAILAIWVLIVWTATSMIYISHEESVVSSDTRLPTDAINKIYFTGYTLSTLGIGNYVPNGHVWEIYTAGISFFGLILLTLSISYIIPTLSADLQKRNLCIYVSSLGESPEKVIINGWNGKDLSNLTTHFHKISQQIMLYGQHHLAYPILHYYHSNNPLESPAMALTALDEALTIILLYIPEHLRPTSLSLFILRRSINSYLQTLHDAFIKPLDKSPPPPDLKHLADAGIPLKNTDNVKSDYEELSDRRKLLAALVFNDGWRWEDMTNMSDGLLFKETRLTMDQWPP